MHPRVERLPAPRPDWRRLLQAVAGGRADRVPLIELAIHPRVVDELLGLPAAGGEPRAAALENVRRLVRLQHRLGYDVVKVSAVIPWRVERLAAEAAADRRQWVDQHHGPIATLEDVARYPWPAAAEVDYAPLEAACQELPDGMGLLGFCGGVLEFSMDLLGMQRFMLATLRQPELVAAVIERVGQTVFTVFEQYCREPRVVALWLGDDLGHKHGLLVSPRLLRELVLPWYRRCVELAHEHGRPLLLHTCGHTQAIMPELVAEVGIDAKHSFEDAIEPVERFYDRWRGRLGVLGGVDVHLLATGPAERIRQRTLEILAHTAAGGYACGSGNSITDYVPADHFLAMIEAKYEFEEGGSAKQAGL